MLMYAHSNTREQDCSGAMDVPMAPLSPRSALRSLQDEPPREKRSEAGPRSNDLGLHSHHKKLHHHQVARPAVAPLGPLPPRKSSLAVILDENCPQAGGHGYTRPAVESGRRIDSSPLHSPYPRPARPTSPPRVNPRSASKNCLSVPCQPQGVSAVSGLPWVAHRQSTSSARSIHSVSDSSSVISLPLPTPPDPFHTQVHPPFSSYTMHSSAIKQEPERLAHIDPATYPSPDMVRGGTHHVLAGLHAPHMSSPVPFADMRDAPRDRGAFAPAHGDDSPFAYTLDSIPASARSSTSSGDWRRSERSSMASQRSAATGADGTHHSWTSLTGQPRRVSSQQTFYPDHPSARNILDSHDSRVTRSVDDYLTSPLDRAPASRVPSHRPSLPTPRADLPPLVGRSSFDGVSGRILAPLRRSPASVSHRASATSLASVSDVSETGTYEPSASMRRVSHGPLSMGHEREKPVAASGCLATLHDNASSAAAKRPRGWTSGDQQRPLRDSASVTTLSKSSADQRRSRSMDRVRAQKQSSLAIPTVKLDHAEVMARLNKKMKERIAAKAQAAAQSNATSSGLPAVTPATASVPVSDRLRHRGDSVSSSVPSTPAASAVSLHSPALMAATNSRGLPSPARSGRQEASNLSKVEHEQSSLRPPPVVGIESLLSAAAINDAESH
ncbi:unnamed protein product [Parajaminaea phylloscopi]